MVDIEVYEAADGWRWRLKAGNGEIVAESGEAYTTHHDADRAAARVKELMAGDE